MNHFVSVALVYIGGVSAIQESGLQGFHCMLSAHAVHGVDLLIV